jgi:hypothetical protein
MAELKNSVPSESAPQELSNEWSRQYVLTILNFGAISVYRHDRSRHQSLKELKDIVIELDGLEEICDFLRDKISKTRLRHIYHFAAN